MTQPPAAPKSRDRLRTAESLVGAAKRVLVANGFQGFGVNAVAREAGCDKQLIYRYFGGLDGLVEAVGEDLAATFEAGMGARVEEEASHDYAGLIEHLALALLDAFRGSELLIRIAAWESADPSPLTRRLSDARGRALGRWVERLRGDRVPPPGIDVAMQNALVIAAVQQIALGARATGGFGGVRLEGEADWARVRAALRSIIRATYALR